MPDQKFSHIVLDGPPATIKRNSGPAIPTKIIPIRNRKTHGDYIRGRLLQAWQDANDEQAVYHAARSGVYFEFKGELNADLITKSLEDMRSKKVRLLNVRNVDETVSDGTTGEDSVQRTTYATVFIDNEKRDHFFKKLEEYATEDTAKGRPKNADLINSISDIRKALLIESFWQDSSDLIPTETPEWCEVWLSNNTDEVIQRFEAIVLQLQIQSKSGVIRFPERAVKVVCVSQQQLEHLSAASDDVAEYRRAKETASFWMEMESSTQADWIDNLLDRMHITNDHDTSVCILDTGVNNGHPLIAPLLSDKDCLTVDAEWGTHDHDKHGTLMAGVTLFGDLMSCLDHNEIVELPYCLESVKILPPPPDENTPDLWGYITSQGISRAEIQTPDRNRIFTSAVTAKDTRDQGRPTSWSGTLDQVTSGADDDKQRLLIISSGNITSLHKANDYPRSQVEDSIHDPAQSWNALTVGAFTNLDHIVDQTLAGYSPVAPEGGLSPFSTTSTSWNDSWPIKPEIVMEGGNVACDDTGFVTECDDLSLLSTFYNLQEGHFYPFNMTSAATANAAWFAGQIQSSHPEYWPETVRALMVHSACWPDTLKQQFLEDESKTSYKRLLRICGYGVPNLEDALYSTSSSLTIISQAELQPYDRRDSGGYETRDLHLYELPWPRDVLLDLPPDTQATMRITLSYFIEPGPGEIGWKDRYRYASYALRFDLNSPGESKNEFIARINSAAEQEDDEDEMIGGHSAAGHWVIGSKARDKGSIHSDIWKGTAAELANSNNIAVFPRIGWWRERNHLGRWNKKCRYALIVSITTQDQNVDIYTPVAIQAGIAVPVEVNV